jgi:hypothetical protein
MVAASCWRSSAPLVDRFTLRLLRRGQLKRENFLEREEDA